MVSVLLLQAGDTLPLSEVESRTFKGCWRPKVVGKKRLCAPGAPLWDTSPKPAKDGSRRGLTNIAQQLYFSERDISLAFRIHELRKGGLTKEKAIDKAVEEINALEEAKKNPTKGEKTKKKQYGDDEDDEAMSFDNADRIYKRYRKDFLAGEAEAKEEADAWARENEGG